MKLSCSDYTFHMLDHPDVVELIARMGFDAIDIAIREGVYWVGPEEVQADPSRWAGRLAERILGRGLAVGDVFFSALDDFDVSGGEWSPAARDRARGLFDATCELTAALGADGLTGLPGMESPDRSREELRKFAGEELAWRVQRAKSYGLDFSVECHVQSVAPTPAEALELLEAAPGLQITLDHSHFVSQGLDQSEADVLVPHTRAVQCRTACPGRLQAPMSQNTIDWRQVVESLRAGGYDGYLTCEFVWQAWERCDECDTLSETILLRDELRNALS